LEVGEVRQAAFGKGGKSLARIRCLESIPEQLALGSDDGLDALEIAHQLLGRTKPPRNRRDHCPR
jgi:hypothetical protein